MNVPTFLPIELHWLWTATWQAAVLAGLVLAVQWLGRNRLSPSSRFVLWWLVLIRLALPVTPSTPWSVFNLTSRPMPAPVATLTPVAPLTGWSELAPPPVREITVVPMEAKPPVPAARPAGSEVATVVFWIWLIGAVGYAGSLLLVSSWLGWHLRRRKPLEDPDLNRLLEACRQNLGLRRRLEVIETPRVKSPAVFGLLRPRLLLPPGLLNTFSATELRHVLLHELAHLRRGDLALNWFMGGVQAVHWFNPLVWMLFRRIRSDRELACDELALEHASESDRAAYGRTVLKLVERWAMPSRLAGAVGILEERRALERRVRAIAGFRPRRPAHLLVATLWISLAAVTLTDGRESTLSSASNINPALLYQRAVLLTPELMGNLSEEDRMVIYGSPYRDLDWTSKNTDRLVALYDDSFDLLRQAVASRAPCDWGPTPFVRSETLEFWHARIKSLGHVARFRARHHLEHHRPDEAAADLLATWVLGRHLPKTEMHFSVLVGISIEALLDDFVAEHFHLFDDTALRQLARGIQSLPDPGPLPDWIERRQPPPTDTDASPVDPNVEAAARAAVARAHHLDLTMAVRRQMILAAINYRLAGLAEFERIRDPAGSGPFQIRRVVVEGVDRGFSLESALDRGLRNEKLVFIEQPGPFLYVDGPRAGQMRPPEQDLETLMQQRYGVSPGVVVPPDETTPGDLEAEEDNLDESGVVFMQAPGVQPRQLRSRTFRFAANALSEKFRDVEVSFTGAHSGPTGEIPLHLGMDLPATAEPYPVGRFGSLSGPFFRSGIPPSSTSRDRPGEFHFPRPADNTPIHVTKDSVKILKAFFLSAGVDLSPPNQIDLDEAKGEPRIRATPREIGIIEKAIEVLGLPESE